MEVNNVNPMKVSMIVTEDTIKINIERSRVLPTYLHYLFEYRNIDYTGKTIEFKDCKCRLVKDKEGYKWQEENSL